MSSTTAASRGLFFFKRFLRSPREVGAILPSTRHLGRAMVRGLDLKAGDLVLEYGPGTGSLTHAIAESVARTPGLRYLGIERDAEFCELLRHRFPSLEFVNSQVEDVRRLLAERDLPAPRAILSGLPLILLPKMTEIVVTASQILTKGGEFRTFSYLQCYPTPSAARLRRLMRDHFSAVDLRLVLKNFPLALILEGLVP